MDETEMRRLFQSAVRRLDEALELLDEAERGHATVVRISEMRAALTGRCVTARRVS